MRTAQHPQHEQLKQYLAKDQWIRMLPLVDKTEDPALHWTISHVTEIQDKKERNTYHNLTKALIDADFNLALRGAACGGLTELVGILLTYRQILGIDIDARGAHTQQTALHRATKGGHAAIVRQLLAHGATLTPKDQAGKTAEDLAQKDDIRDLLTRPTTSPTESDGYDGDGEKTNGSEPEMVDSPAVCDKEVEEGFTLVNATGN